MYLNRFSIKKGTRFDKFSTLFLIWYKRNNIPWSGTSITSLKHNPKQLYPDLEKLFFEKFQNLYEDLSINIGETFILFPPVKKGHHKPLNWFYKLLIQDERYKERILLVESDYYNLKTTKGWQARDKIINLVAKKWVLKSTSKIEQIENIIFVDDIFTRGTTISQLIDFLVTRGFKCERDNYSQYDDLKNVFGLFLAKTESTNDMNRKWERENFVFEKEISNIINESEKNKYKKI